MEEALVIREGVDPYSKSNVDEEPNYNSHLHTLPAKDDYFSEGFYGAWMRRPPTYENTTLPYTSNSEPSSQNTAGFGSRKKKNGSTLKNTPVTIPCSSVEVEDPDATCDKEAVAALSSESIHCSSKARACSSSGKLGQPTQRDLQPAILHSSSLAKSRSR